MNYRYKKTFAFAVLFSLVATMPGQVHGWWSWSSNSLESGKNTSNTSTMVIVGVTSFVAGVAATGYVLRNVFKKHYAQKPGFEQTSFPDKCTRPDCAINAGLLSKSCARRECLRRWQENELNKNIHTRVDESAARAMKFSDETDEENSQLKADLANARAENKKNSLLFFMALRSIKQNFTLIPKAREEQVSSHFEDRGYATKGQDGEFHAKTPNGGDSFGDRETDSDNCDSEVD